jgi:hypothetical protein
MRTGIKVTGLFALTSGLFICLAWFFPGRMTGGGSVFMSNGGVVTSADMDSSGRVTHGFELHCSTEPPALPPTPNNLEINWGLPGDRHHFHLDVLMSADCFMDTSLNAPNPPDADFNTMIGVGTGDLDGKSGATIHFTLTDQGEPGVLDTAAYLITDAGGTVVLSVDTTRLTFGNQQAHNGN